MHRQILKKIVDTKTAMGENLRAAAFALTEAKYAAGDFRHTVFDNVDQATVKVPRTSDHQPPMHNPHAQV
jgi:V-type H+-transporting ATPase subunit D